MSTSGKLHTFFTGTRHQLKKFQSRWDKNWRNNVLLGIEFSKVKQNVPEMGVNSGFFNDKNPIIFKMEFFWKMI